MNSHLDHPDLTAFALGEGHADHVVEWMDQADVRNEVDCISDLATHLQATTAIPTAQLHPHQKAAVLTPPELVRQMVAAAKVRDAKPRSRVAPVAWAVFKYGAAAALVAASFVAGTQISVQEETATAAAPEPKASQPQPELPPHVQIAKVKVAEAPMPVTTPAQPQPKLVAPLVQTPAVVMATLPAADATLRQPVQPKSVIQASTVQQASRQPESVVSLSTEGLIVSVLTADGLTAGAPMSQDPLAKPTTGAKEKTPALRIHSWSAEVMACPWQTELRLVRVALQVPSDQARRSGYPVLLQFDPNSVRSHRSLGQRVIPAADASGPAHIILWHELTPNGQPGSTTAPRQLGTVKLPESRFTTPAMAPFDGTSLRIMDRGYSVSEAKDDFRFESALIGFSLLMQGDAAKPEPSLLQALAQEAQSAADPYGERAKLVKLLEAAKDLAGM
jgi:hypothetical protein